MGLCQLASIPKCVCRDRRLLGLRLSNGRSAMSSYSAFGENVVRKHLKPSTNKLRRIHAAEQSDIPTLSYGLDRVLFNPGVHFLQDPRTGLFNFDPFLHSIVQPDQFNFAAISKFVPAFQDKTLLDMAKRHSAKFFTSTSSISASLGTIYFCIAHLKPLNLSLLSGHFSSEPRSHTQLTRSPSSVILRPHEHGIRSIMVEKAVNEADDQKNVLQMLGHSLEKLFTMEKAQYLGLLKSSTNPLAMVHDQHDIYAHTQAGSILMRSQLDCQDSRLPRRTFDLKTRAVLPIRMDVANYRNYTDYQLYQLNGLFGSFEREFYDMCRSAILKYNFQVRIGDMDGIFVAYHNTQNIFGFQYLSREMMDDILYGNEATGEAVFSLATALYNEILELIVPQYRNDEIIRLSFSIDRLASKLTIFAEGFKNAVPTFDEKSKHIAQYTLTCWSSVNGHRTDKILLNEPDDWTLYYQLNKVATNLAEFAHTRRQMAEVNKSSLEDVEIDKKDLPIFRNMYKHTNAKRFTNGQPDHCHDEMRKQSAGMEVAKPTLIGSWAVPSK